MFFLLAHGTWATHVRGGYLDYRWLSANSYEFSAIIYLDANGVHAQPEITIAGLPDLVTLPLIAYEPIPGAAGKDTRKGIYRGVYTFPVIPFLGVVIYKAAVILPNRNTGVVNLSPPSDQISYFIETEIQINPYLGANSSPVFSDNLPVINAPINETSIAAISATDADGDSLVYSIIPTLQSKGKVATGYVQPDQVSACASCTFTIDRDSGTITWDRPVRGGEYVVTVKVEEYRRVANTSNYTRNGYITRDIQVLVYD